MTQRGHRSYAQAAPFVLTRIGCKQPHGHSGSPALRSPSAKAAKSSVRRNGNKSLRFEARKPGLHSSNKARPLLACSGRPASELLAAKPQIVSRKVGLVRIALSAFVNAAS